MRKKKKETQLLLFYFYWFIFFFNNKPSMSLIVNVIEYYASCIVAEVAMHIVAEGS